ncbi:hypothetical protein C7212DRAFT_344409 [Tuber magnatum]|uniref:Uncharacterized protein n=1 Tax=Tuber magnatum TaxID=42249 RepID=A0A317SMM1_9PEZI|nr:hypothetical protein C7212DRAFT_344409 [Tuber magnatum]
MAPTEAQVEESDALKQQGNIAFAKKSATLLSMNKLALALNDANQAIKLDPTWSKAYRRKASVLEAQKELDKAKGAFEESLKVALADPNASPTQKQKEETEIKKSIEAIEKKIAERPSYQEHITKDTEDTVGQRVMREFERSEMQFQNALSNLLQYHKRQIPGAPPGVLGIFGRVQTLEELTTALLEDSRVIRLNGDAIEKLQLCYQLEQHQRNAIGPDLSPKDTIIAYNRRLSLPPQNGPVINNSGGSFSMGPASSPVAGWDLVRPALQLSIRSALMNGCLAGIVDPGNDEKEFRRAVELIEEAWKMWPNVDGATRGRTLEETFLRGVKTLLGESIARSYGLSPTSPNAQRKKLKELRAIGQWLVDSFNRSPKPPNSNQVRDDADPWWNIYYAHYVAPVARGHSFIAYYHTQMGIDWLEGEEKRASLRKGAEEYAIAAGWMSPDDPDRISRIRTAVFSLFNSGKGYYKSDFAACLEMGENVKEWAMPFFGDRFGIQEDHMGQKAGIAALGMAQPQTNGEDTLVITKVMRDVWAMRVSKHGEKEKAVGGTKIWGALGSGIVADLEADGLA